MSAPNVNVSHSICDFVARHKSSVFDGAPMSPSTRRQTNRKSLGREGSYSGGWSQAGGEGGGGVGGKSSEWHFSSPFHITIPLQPTLSPNASPRRACWRRFTLPYLPN